ncbi:MAG: ABC transporter permease, partial [Neofamilia sp.]
LLETLSKLNFTLDPIVILIFLAFFIVGYILYLYIYAALGATVSNTEEINTALGPIMIIVVLVYLATVFALSLPDPDNIVLKILSFIPFSSMFVIHTRYAITDMTLMEVGISFGILLVTTLILSAISVRIYRSASLNYGNRDKLSKIIKKFKRK